MKRAEAPADLETRLIDGDHEALRLWLRLLTCSNLITAEIRRRLRHEFATTLPRFDLMAQLQRHRDGLSMRDLSRRLMVTGGNVTGLTDQLEREGLVERQLQAADRRSYVVRLTTAGRRRFEQMASAHESWVRELFHGLTSVELRRLFGLLAKLKHHAARPKQENPT
jgi:DNA-binding MarR family transcriptional regulator